MSRILVEFEKWNSTTELTKKSLELVFSCESVAVRYKLIDEINMFDLDWCDSYIAIRPNTPLSEAFAKAIKEADRFYCVFFDDDLISRECVIKWRNRCSSSCLKIADIVIGVNSLLVGEYALLTRRNRCHVIHTPLCVSEYHGVHKINERIQFVYAAGRDHAGYFEREIKPILNRFLHKNHSKAHFTFIGVEPDIHELEHKECFSFLPLMTLHEYNSTMMTTGFHVGLAPLDDTPFSNRKYYNKYIEYSKNGILGVYSNCLPYSLIVVDGENGLLVNNSEDDWLSALEKIISEPNLIQKCVRNAQQKLRIEHDIVRVKANMREAIPELYCHECSKAIKWKKRKMKNGCFLLLDKLVKLYYSIVNDGLEKSARKIMLHYNDTRRAK